MKTSQLALLLLLLFSNVVFAEKLNVGDTFPDFELTRLEGKGEIRLGDYRGRVVVINFWASWCEPCKRELPRFSQLAKKYEKKGLSILAVSVDDERESALVFVKKYPASQIEILFDDGKSLANKTDLKAMPTTYVVDRSGKVSWIHQGFKPGDIERFEKEVLKKL